MYTYNCILGGQEEKLEKKLQLSEDQSRPNDQRHRRTTGHSLVTTFCRNKEAIRPEIVSSSKHYLKVMHKDIFKYFFCYSSIQHTPYLSTNIGYNCYSKLYCLAFFSLDSIG